MLNIFWIFLIVFLLYFGIMVSKKINYRNYNIIKMLKSFKEENKLGLFMTLGTKIGVGSLIGTTAAIFIGGPSTILWMCIFSLLTSSLIYIECKIGGMYKEKINNSYVSGPYYIIKNGLNNKILGIIVGLILIITYSFLFLMIQTNTIASIITLNINVSYSSILIILLIILLLTVTFNLKELLNIINYLVPLMCTLFVLVSLYIIIKNIDMMDNIVLLIFKDVFNIKSFLIGMIVGIKRSVFLNEVLIGTTSSTGLAASKDDEKTALTEVLGSYFITFVVGTLNSLIVLLFLYNSNVVFNNYNELINSVFIYHLGDIGSYFLIILLLLFGITTIISGIYIGISNLENMINSKLIGFIFKIFVVLFCCIGLYINIDLLWSVVDIFLFLLLLINGTIFYIIFRRKKI